MYDYKSRYDKLKYHNKRVLFGTKKMFVTTILVLFITNIAKNALLQILSDLKIHVRGHYISPIYYKDCKKCPISDSIIEISVRAAKNFWYCQYLSSTFLQWCPGSFKRSFQRFYDNIWCELFTHVGLSILRRDTFFEAIVNEKIFFSGIG